MNGHRLLLVEDHEATRLTLKKLLALLGLEVVEAASVAEAMAELDVGPGFD